MDALKNSAISSRVSIQNQPWERKGASAVTSIDQRDHGGGQLARDGSRTCSCFISNFVRWIDGRLVSKDLDPNLESLSLVSGSFVDRPWSFLIVILICLIKFNIISLNVS